jgi:hypothetical protein
MCACVRAYVRAFIVRNVKNISVQNSEHVIYQLPLLYLFLGSVVSKNIEPLYKDTNSVLLCALCLLHFTFSSFKLFSGSSSDLSLGRMTFPLPSGAFSKITLAPLFKPF